MNFEMAAGPWLFAHRGAPTRWPENSLEAFGEALNVGADVLELDVHMTADGHIVVSHDAVGTRCAGVDRAIHESTLAEVKAWSLQVCDGADTARPAAGEAEARAIRVPTLAEVLEAFPEVPLNIDVKSGRAGVVEALLRCLRSHGAERRVLLTSFAQTTLSRIQAADYPGPTGLARWDAVQALLLPEALLGLRRPPGQRLQIPCAAAGLRLDVRSHIERAHRHGYFVDYWVVDDPDEAERLLDMGADGIVTDRLDLLSSLFQRHVRCGAYRARHPLAVSQPG